MDSGVALRSRKGNQAGTKGRKVRKGRRAAGWSDIKGGSVSPLCVPWRNASIGSGLAQTEMGCKGD